MSFINKRRQDRANLSACDAHPSGVTAATFCAESEILILAGPQLSATGSRELTAWRRVDESPFITITLSEDLPKVKIVIKLISYQMLRYFQNDFPQFTYLLTSCYS